MQRLYLLEGFRSHVLEFLDDLHGQSCTPLTLRKADVVVEMLREHFTLLQEQQGLFFGDETRTRAELIARYQELRSQAVAYQLPGR